MCIRDSGISIDRNLKLDKALKFDSRALSVQEVVDLKKEVLIPHLSIHINWYHLSNDIIAKVANEINPQSLNVFLPTSSFSSTKDNNYSWFNKTIKFLNEINQEVISFGDGFTYDDGGFTLKKNELDKINKLKFIELNSFTIDNQQELYIKSKIEWKEYFNSNNIEREIKQELLGDLIKETVTNEFENLAILIDDKFITKMDPNQLKSWNCSGVTMSIKSKANDIYNSNESGIGLSSMANRYELSEIIEVTERVKSHYA